MGLLNEVKILLLFQRGPGGFLLDYDYPKIELKTISRAEKTELMVFITPHVVYTDEDANNVTEEQKSKLNWQN